MIEVTEKSMAQEFIDRKLIASTVFPTGNPWLDDCFAGGLNRNNMMLVAAKTGVGKTFFGIQLATHAARRQKNVVYFALEAEKYEIERRQLYYEISRLLRKHYPNLPVPRYREWLHMGTMDPEWLAVEKEATDKLALDLDTLKTIYRTNIYTPEMFKKDVEGLAAGNFIGRPDLIILDHLHHMFLGGNEIEALKTTIHAIKRLHQLFEIPVVILAQLRKDDASKGNKARTMPALDDVRGTAALVDIATDVLIISPFPADREGELPDDFRIPMFFHLAKSRTAPECTRYVGAIGFEASAGSYTRRYVVFKNRVYEDPELIESQVPDWAKNAMRPKSADFIHSKPKQKIRKDIHGDD